MPCVLYNFAVWIHSFGSQCSALDVESQPDTRTSRALKHHTIILVPHARAKFRKWRITSLQAGLLIGSLALVTIGGLIAALSYFTVSIDRQQLSDLERENAELREVNDGFERSIHDLETQLTSYQERIRELAIVAGLTVLPQSGETGIGGLAPAPSDDVLGAAIDDLETRIESMGDGLGELQTKFTERSLRIASTPAIAPVKGLISSGFGYRRDPFTNSRAFHNGLDIIAPRGREVRATGDGIVTRSGRMGALGNAVYISHGLGITTRYGHLSRLNVEPGTRVRRGDVVGFIGNTGRSSGYHLHYEVRVDGKPTNPRAYILDSIRN